MRTAMFDADKGFFLNGKSVKIQGTCNHQDHAGVGAAVPDALQWFRLAVLREMGGNAVRTSHNMPTPEWVEACDRMGMMMMCETRQMSSNPEGMAQLETMVKRYRNSPSIILWSVGNEENHIAGRRWPSRARGSPPTMVRRCHELDPTRVVSAAVNGDNEKGVSDAFDIIGFNYDLEFPDKYHKEHPEAADLRIGNFERHRHARRVQHRSAAQHGELLRWRRAVGRNRGGVVEVLRDARVGGGRICVDGLRLSRRAHALWMAFDQLAVRHRGYVRVSEGQLLLLQSVVGQGSGRCICFRTGTWTGGKATRFRSGSTRTSTRWSCSSTARAAGSQKVPHLGHVEWKVRYEPGVIEARGCKRRQSGADGEARDDRAGRGDPTDRRSHARSMRMAKTWR